MSEGADMKFHIQTPFEKQIVGALRCCIDAHGPVTREFVGSAAKRIAAQLEALQEAQSLPEFGGEDVRYFCRACGTKWVGDKLKRMAGPREVVGQHCGGTMEKVER